MESLERFFTILGKIWLAHWGQGADEEAWLPVFVRRFPLCSFLALSFFDFLLEGRGERVLFADDSICDAFPELPRFVGELFFHGWDDLGDGEERVEVDEEDFLL